MSCLGVAHGDSHGRIEGSRNWRVACGRFADDNTSSSGLEGCKASWNGQKNLLNRTHLLTYLCIVDVPPTWRVAIHIVNIKTDIYKAKNGGVDVVNVCSHDGEQ